MAFLRCRECLPWVACTLQSSLDVVFLLNGFEVLYILLGDISEDVEVLSFMCLLITDVFIIAFY